MFATSWAGCPLSASRPLRVVFFLLSFCLLATAMCLVLQHALQADSEAAAALASVSELIFFLLGAMTVVEVCS
jgi:hypothetical protein